MILLGAKAPSVVTAHEAVGIPPQGDGALTTTRAPRLTERFSWVWCSWSMRCTSLVKLS